MTYPVHRVLRECGNEIEFNCSLERLHEEDPCRIKVMEQVCARLEFGELLKYSSQFAHHKSVGSQLNLEYQIDRVATYLALTSLDIIAREQIQGSEFHNFPDWFLSAVDEPLSRPSIVSLIDALSDPGETSVTDILRSTIPQVKDAYHAEEGVTRLFKRILKQGVDSWMREWLCSVYFLAKDAEFRDTITPSSLPWSRLPSDDRFSLIVDYFFSLRNQYTHTSTHADTQEFNQFRGPKCDSPSFSIRYSDIPDAITDKVKWFVALRSDLAESEVVRVISVHLMRKWLGFQDGPPFIETYLSRLSFRFYAYSLDQELLYNSQTIGKWALIDSRIVLLNRFDLESMLLATASATNLQDITVTPQRYRPFILERLPDYLSLSTSLNSSLQSVFETAASLQDDIHRVDMLIREKLQELACSDDARRFLHMIDDLRQAIDQTLSVPFY